MKKRAVSDGAATTAFIAVSPFQIISSLNIMTDLIQKNYGGGFVLFTTRESGVLKEIRNQRIFKEIYVIDRNKKGNNFFYLIKTLFFPLMAVRDQVSKYDKKLILEHIYCTDCNSLICSLYLYNLKINPSIKLHLIEDGARNYCVQFDHYKKLRKIMNFFSLPLYADNFFDTVVFNSDMLELTGSLKTANQLNFYKNQSAIFLVKEIYKKKIFPNEINFKDLIYFNQPFFCGNTNIFKKIESDVLRVVREFASNEHFKFKNHPKFFSNQMPRKNQLETLVFEPYFIDEQEKLDHITLVGISSTALFSPKLMFDKEPVVIFLYEIFKNYFENSKNSQEITCYINGSFSKAVQRLRNIYREKSKVIVPKTLADLKKVLTRILS
ncbi:MAG: hypothetical protein LBI55_03210 [Oscillospiraceae bacterium]|jgi:hypothetical protein|nr:hypothetical protein [Oscillospiraceae bacterium]